MSRRPVTILLLILLCACADTGEVPLPEQTRLRQTAFRPAPTVLPVAPDRPAAAPTPTPAVIRPAEPVSRQDQFYDPESPAFGTLQKANQALAGFPLDRAGFVDWMRALREGLIQPRAGLQETSRDNVLDMDVIMRDTREMPYVRFPHRGHTEWLDCTSCHPDPFDTVGGGLPIRMEEIFRGNYCGKCHDRVAFISWYACDRCHSVPQHSAPPPTSRPQTP